MQRSYQNNRVGELLAKSPFLNRHPIFSFFILALGLSLTCSSVSATTILPITFDDCVSKAEQIFVGLVEEMHAELNDEETAIYTYVTFSVLETIEGTVSPDYSYTIRLTGGHVGDKHSLIIGMPEFKIGDMLLLFVHLNNRAMCPIVGWTQGYYRIDDLGSQRVVTDYSHNSIVGVDGSGTLMRSNSMAMAQKGSASPGDCVEEEGNAGTLVLNQYSSFPAMTLDNFVVEIQTSRAFFGYQPERVSERPGQWIRIPEDFDEFMRRLTLAPEPALVPGRSDAWIPRPITFMDDISTDN